MRRTLAVAVCSLAVAAVCASAAETADAARVKIHAAPDGRLSLRLVGPAGSGAHEFVVDGRKHVRTHGRAVKLGVRHGPVARGPRARWRRVVVRRAGSRRVVARARFAIGGTRSRAAPTLVVTRAPPKRTTKTVAVLRFSSSNRTARCRRDGSRFKRCSRRVVYRGLSPGRHRFAVRAANRHGRATVRLTSTVVAPLAATPPAPSPTGPCGAAGAPPARWDHVVWIVMENKGYGQIVGSPDAPYLNALAAQCGSAANFFAEAHPSLPNYIAMTSGSTQGITDNEGPSSHPLDVPSIFSQLGADWRALQESMPSNCSLSSSGDYVVRHNPAAYYTNVRAACERQDVPLAATPDLSARFTFVTPNLCHDMHSCGSTAGDQVQVGDQWLAGFMPSVLSSAQYQAGRTAVFITWDEDDESSDQHIATLVVAPSVPAGTAPTTAFNHYSLLRTTEEMLGLPAIGNASAAASMRASFRLG